jgi:Fe2+ or Zn2+ uptake regulation protein
MNKDYRMTKQRRIILETLKSVKTHPTAEELFEMLKRLIPRISLATVYRNLNILIEQGLISVIILKGMPRRFDGDLSSHYHIKCSNCGIIEDVHLDINNEQLTELKTVNDFTIHGYKIEFEGICSICLKQQ